MRFGSYKTLAVFACSFAFLVAGFGVNEIVFGADESVSSVKTELIEEGRKLAEIQKQKELKRIEKEYEVYISSIEKKYSDKIDEKRQTLSLLEEKLEKNYIRFDESNAISKDNAEKIILSEKQITSLGAEISDLDTDIAEREKRITILSRRINSKENDIALLTRHKSDLLEAKEVQQEMVMDFFELYQMEDDEFMEDKELKGVVEILFTDKSPTEEILELAALSEIEKKSRESFYLFERASSKVNESTLVIQEENQKIMDLKEKLESEMERLESKKAEKRMLLLDTKNSERGYQKLWKESLAQMHEAAMQVKSIKMKSGALNDELKKVEKQMRFEKRIITKERIREKVLEELSDSSKISVSDLGKIFSFESSEYSPLNWPVNPKKGISAYFHDSGYKKRFQVAHNAIDIPVDQGSKIHAATAGYVYKAVDNGKGYSYIILLHRDNIRTVYGHVSRIDVKEGQMVQEGEVIGLSGGKPGTDGAGRMTTGPHLHFEVLEGEKWRNPLEYLPLDALPESAL